MNYRKMKKKKLKPIKINGTARTGTGESGHLQVPRGEPQDGPDLGLPCHGSSKTKNNRTNSA